MPADTYSSILGVLLMGTGNDNATWGSNANAGVFTVLEESIAGMLLSAVTGGTLDLTSPGPPTTTSQVHYKTLYFSGTLTGTQTIVVPALTKTWNVVNTTTGDIYMKTPAGTSITIPQGTAKTVWCDGTNVYRQDKENIGKVEMFAGASVPPGSFECNGSYLSRTAFPELYAQIGTNWGTSDITNFRLPYMTDTGRFPRSRIPGTNDVGTYQANNLGPHTHTATFTAAGTAATAGAHTHTATSTVTDPTHTHTVTVFNSSGTTSNFGTGSGTFVNTSVTTSASATGITVGTTTASAGDHTHTVSVSGTLTTDSTGTSETRPEAAVFRFCIRY